MKILLLSYENDADVYASLANKFLSLGYEVEVFICDFFSVTIAKQFVKKRLLKSGISEKLITDFKEELEYINKLTNFDEKIDFNYLVGLEDKFIGNRTLNNLIHTDFILNVSNHNRTYISNPSDNRYILKLVELMSKKIEKKLSDFMPDLVFTYGNHHFAKNLFYEVSQSLKIKYLSLDTARIDRKYILVDNFWIGASMYIKNYMKKLEEENSNCIEALEYINKIKVNNKQAYDFEGNYGVDNPKRYDFLHQLIPVLKTLKGLPRSYIHEQKDRKERGVKNNYFSPKSVFNVLYYNFRSVFRVKKYFSNKVLNSYSFPEEPYILVTLHMVPENNIFTDPDYINEKELIIMLSKLIPINYKIVVKANPSMLMRFADTHPCKFYEDIAKIHNVIVASPKLKSMPYISKAKAVVTISGTSLMEAALLGIPAFAFGNPEFDVLDGIYKFDKKTFMKKLNEHKYVEDNNHKYYIQAMIENSIELEFSKYYMSDKTTCESDEFKKNYLDKLVNLILKTYKRVK